MYFGFSIESTNSLHLFSTSDLVDSGTLGFCCRGGLYIHTFFLLAMVNYNCYICMQAYLVFM